MTESRESPRVTPVEDPGPGRPSSSRRFARLVESPAARRVAIPRLAVAIAAGLLFAALLWLGMAWIYQSMTGWVEKLPEHQLAMSEVVLDPAPPPWIRTGAAGILKKVREETRRGETLPVLSLDLAQLARDFTRSPWVEQVPEVSRSYRGLVVRLVYRKPVAVAEFQQGLAVVIDKQGVILPTNDIDWLEQGPGFRPRGFAEPLTLIGNVSAPVTISPGLYWKRAGTPDAFGDRDQRVLGAARLAEFLQSRPKASPSEDSAPAFIEIWPDQESLRYFLKDSKDHCVFWDRAPGSEPLGEPTAVEKWKMLMEWVDRHGPIQSRPPEYLAFTRSGVEIRRWSGPEPEDRDRREERAGRRPIGKEAGAARAGRPGH